MWSSCLQKIDAFVLRGLKSAFMSAVGSLLRRVELYEQVLNTYGWCDVGGAVLHSMK